MQAVARPYVVSAFYNSAAISTGPASRLGAGWGLDYTQDVQLTSNADNSVTLHASGGLTGVFALVTASTTNYTSPAGFEDTLVKTSTGWTLTEHRSQRQWKFDSAGKLSQVLDRNGNPITVAVTAGSGAEADLAITTNTGPTAGRQVKVTTDASGKTTLAQGQTTVLRQAAFTRTSNEVTQFTDTLGRSTTFGYTGSLLTSIVAPGGVETDIGYDSSNKVIAVQHVEASGTGPGSSVTRLAYPSTTQTLVASPNTTQSLSVSSVPHVTYTLNADQRVTQAVDQLGRTRSRTYTPNFATATDTIGTGASASTVTNTYGANSGESLTKTQAPTGASDQLSYANTSGPAQYSPTGSTDDAGNASSYGYDTAGNPNSSTDALNAQTSLTYNADGTVATATAPGNGTNATTYSYTNKKVTKITAPTGSTIGDKTYTYDNFGRFKTVLDGRGITTTYVYDLLDRVTAVNFSDGTAVSYGYDSAGRNNSRTDVNGTISYSYDQLGRLTSRQNTAGGGLMQYSYDKASQLIQSVTPAGGTVSYHYDDAGTPTQIIYPAASGGTQTLELATDDHGRRTDLWMDSNTAHTTWSAHQHIDYDGSGRPTRILGETGPSSTDHTTVVDLTYCYMAASTPGGTCPASSTNDRRKIQWRKDNVTGAVTTYSYDGAGRLLQAAVSGGNTYDYGYNSRGDRTSADSQTLTFNAADQITSTGFAYDADGNLTADPTSGATDLTYTATNQPKTVTIGGTTYTYTHAGTSNTEMLSQTVPGQGTTVTYSYAYGRPDANGQPVVESITRDNGTVKTGSVLSDPITGAPLMLQVSTGVQGLYINDTTGSPIAMVTSNHVQSFNYAYDPFGVPTLTYDNGSNTVPQNPYTFSAGIQDRATGWIHYGNRYYNPKTGTFTQQDTLDTPLDFQNANRYAYVGNDPINNTDPSGRRGLGCAAGDCPENGV